MQFRRSWRRQNIDRNKNLYEGKDRFQTKCLIDQILRPLSVYKYTYPILWQLIFRTYAHWLISSSAACAPSHMESSLFVVQAIRSSSSSSSSSGNSSKVSLAFGNSSKTCQHARFVLTTFSWWYHEKAYNSVSPFTWRTTQSKVSNCSLYASRRFLSSIRRIKNSHSLTVDELISWNVLKASSLNKKLLIISSNCPFAVS